MTFGLILALLTTAIPKASGSFFRGVWLLPRMSPSVLYILLWLWVINPSEFGLLNQILIQVFGAVQPVDLLSSAPVALIIISNGFIGASMGMIIFTSAIRGIPEHLFHAARVDGAGTLAIVRHIILPALRWPISFITIYQTLSLLVSFEYILLLTEGGPFFDTTVYALYIYRRAFESGQYAYGAALALFLIVIGIVVALLGWRLFDMTPAAAAAADRGALSMATAVGESGQALRLTQTDWDRLAARARWSRRARISAIYAFLIAVSLPVILPYFWLVTIAFSARTGIAETSVLWRSVLVLVPALLAFWIWSLVAKSMRQMAIGSIVIAVAALVPFLILVGPELHLRNFIFIWQPDFVDVVRSRTGEVAGSINFPSVWLAFANSLYLAAGQTLIVATVASLAGYYLVALPVPGARRDAALAAGAARVPGADADRAAVPDPELCRPARHADRRDPGPGRPRAAVRDLHHEGLLRRGALGHRDERLDRRRVAPPGLPPGRAAAGQERPDRDLRVLVHPRLGRVHLRLHVPDQKHQLDHEPVHVLRARRRHGGRLRRRLGGRRVLSGAEPRACTSRRRST